MRILTTTLSGSALALGLTLLATPSGDAFAQDDATPVEEVIVTGSRIRRDPLNDATPITEISIGDIQKTGLTNLGDALQNLPIT